MRFRPPPTTQPPPRSPLPRGGQIRRVREARLPSNGLASGLVVKRQGQQPCPSLCVDVGTPPAHPRSCWGDSLAAGSAALASGGDPAGASQAPAQLSLPQVRMPGEGLRPASRAKRGGHLLLRLLLLRPPVRPPVGAA